MNHQSPVDKNSFLSCYFQDILFTFDFQSLANDEINILSIYIYLDLSLLSFLNQQYIFHQIGGIFNHFFFFKYFFWVILFLHTWTPKTVVLDIFVLPTDSKCVFKFLNFYFLLFRLNNFCRSFFKFTDFSFAISILLLTHPEVLCRCCVFSSRIFIGFFYIFYFSVNIFSFIISIFTLI